MAWDRISRLLDNVTVGSIVISIALILLWLVRQFLSHRRWLRATKIQTDLHTRLLERMQSADEIKTYLQSAEMTKFLTDAPTAFGDARPGMPAGRILAALQAGIVLVCAGSGILLVKRLIGAYGPGSEILVFGGVLLLSLGIGFVAAAGASFAFSRRTGVWPPPPTRRDDASSL